MLCKNRLIIEQIGYIKSRYENKKPQKKQPRKAAKKFDHCYYITKKEKREIRINKSLLKGALIMSDSKFKVLLYSDGSQQAFSAAVYTASLLMNMPNMDLTIVKLQESSEGFMGTEYSWKELRPKYKRFYRECSGENGNWFDTWPVNPNAEWMKRIFASRDRETQEQYSEILRKTNEIFFQKGFTVNQKVLNTNINISDTSDTVDALLDYAKNNSFSLIIMGTRGFATINGLILGCLGHKVLNKSAIPVLLIKKLPKEFIDNFLADNQLAFANGVSNLTKGQINNVVF